MTAKQKEAIELIINLRNLSEYADPDDIRLTNEQFMLLLEFIVDGHDVEETTEMGTLIKKRQVVFALMGEYGGTATLDYVRHDIVDRIEKITKE